MSSIRAAMIGLLILAAGGCWFISIDTPDRSSNSVKATAVAGQRAHPVDPPPSAIALDSSAGADHASASPSIKSPSACSSDDTQTVKIDTSDLDPDILARAATMDQPVDLNTLRLATRIKKIVDGNPYAASPPIFCYEEGTDPERMSRLWELVPELNPYARYQFNDNNRWGGSGLQGQPLTLTWSLVPDGLSVDGGTSELFSRLDAQFGNRALWISRIEQSFSRWAELSGMSYTRVTAPGVDWDDGAAWFTAGGPTRGDVRIAMIDIDGGGGVLAYNYFPPTGDMVLDRSESWGSQAANNYRFFRNVLMHEHGHGLGFSHICPIYNLWLMEPFLNTGFDGPQHDEIRAVHRGYGDAFEPNNTFAQATYVGNVIFGSPIVIGTTPLPAVTNGSLLSIDGNNDIDWYRFTVIAESTATATVTPVGRIYDNSPQQCSGQLGNCCAFNIIDSREMAMLNIEIYASNGTTLLAGAYANAPGASATVTDVELPGSPGDYYIRISKADSGVTSQLYRIDLAVITVGADISPPQPNPSAFEVPPTPISTNTITMTAAEASDATTPILYQFNFFSGGSGGGPSSLFQEDRTWSDTGLLPNRYYTYRLRTRDSAPHPGPNTGDYSENYTTATFIDTPAGISFGTITDSSIQMMLTAPLPSFYQVELSGILFESTTPGGNDGLQEWIQVTSDTAINLAPNTQYEFRAKARNRMGIETSTYSPTNSAVTLAVAPAVPTLANPSSASMKINTDAGTNPAHTELAILCVATSPHDANWEGMYADAAGAPGAAAVWQTDAAWGNRTLTGMQPSTQYTFVVRARNLNHIETVNGPSASLATQAPGYCDLLGDINDDGFVDGLDVAGFTRVILGIPDVGDNINCADYGNGDVLLDAGDFAGDLLDD